MSVHIYMGKEVIGSLTMERKGLYATFWGEMREPGLKRIIAEFERGELSLGYPIPKDGRYYVNLSVPASKLPEGRLLRGCVEREKNEWQAFSATEIRGVSVPEGIRKGSLVRFLWEPGFRLPADELLCFYEYVTESGKSYLQINLDDLQLKSV